MSMQVPASCSTRQMAALVPIGSCYRATVQAKRTGLGELACNAAFASQPRRKARAALMSMTRISTPMRASCSLRRRSALNRIGSALQATVQVRRIGLGELVCLAVATRWGTLMRSMQMPARCSIVRRVDLARTGNGCQATVQVKRIGLGELVGIAVAEHMAMTQRRAARRRKARRDGT